MKMNVPKRKIMRVFKVFAVILVIAIIILLIDSALRQKSVLQIFHTSYQLGDFELDSATIIYTLTHNSKKYLSVALPADVQNAPYSNCKSASTAKAGLCLQWSNMARLEVKPIDNDDTGHCYNIVWTPKSKTFKPMDCFMLSDAHWFGCSALKSQQWPLEEVSIDMQPYISSYGDNIGAFGSVIERYWITSDGLGIVVDNSVPLHISINQNHDNFLCFKSDYNASNVYPNPQNNLPVLRYSVCKGENVKAIHDYLSKKTFNLPIGSPDEEIMKYPIWSTFARFRENVTQSDVLTLVNNIHKNSFPASLIEIEKGYERGIGNFNFNNKIFRNAHQMIGELRESKLKVSTSVNPLIANTSYNYFEAVRKHYVMNQSIYNSSISFKPFNFTFDKTQVSLIDLTNSKVLQWFKSNLELIQTDHLINSFKFDLGEASFLSNKMSSHNVLHNPCEYTTHYIELASMFGNRVIVKSGHQTQKFPVYVEIGDRSSSWSKDDGLSSLIPTVITYGLLGYPFIIPGPIGGISQTINNSIGLPSIPHRELFIRWLQLSAFLPVMQFSVAPWQYDEEVVKISKDFVTIHETKVLPLLLLASKESQINGSPIIRPLWWIAPTDDTALRIDCEFLVGDSLLVAPILDEGALHRDIYLPEGNRWEDQLRDTHHEGGQWLTDYEVGIHEIATFVRLRNPL